MNQKVPELVAWPISGNPSNHEEFLQRLQHFSSHLGDPKRSQTMAPCFRNRSHWYSQRDRNPTEGPVEGMANFLSDLFKEEQSLNSCTQRCWLMSFNPQKCEFLRMTNKKALPYSSKFSWSQIFVISIKIWTVQIFVIKFS